MNDLTSSSFDFEYPLAALEVTACDLVITTPQSRDPLADETVRKVLKMLKEQHGADAAFVCELRNDGSSPVVAGKTPRTGFHDDATGDVYVLAVCRQVFGPVSGGFIQVPVVLADGRNYGTLYGTCKSATEDDRRRDAALIEMTAQLTARLVDARRMPARSAPSTAREAQPQYA